MMWCKWQVGLSRGFAYVEYESPEDAEEARNNMHGGQLDGNVITCAPFVLLLCCSC